MRPGEQGHRAHPRLDPDARGGLLLTLAAVAALLVAVPFALLVLLVRGHYGPLRSLDVGLDDRLHSYAVQHPGFVHAMRLVSDVGAPLTFQVLAGLGGLLLVVRRQPRLAGWLVVTVWGSGLLDTVLKQAVGRARPHFADPVAHAASASFPSGHALGSFVGVSALLLVVLPLVAPAWRLPLRVAGVLVVVAVGFSRLALGVHYLSDVVGGWVVGAAWLAATAAGFRMWRKQLGRATLPLPEGLEPASPEPR